MLSIAPRLYLNPLLNNGRLILSLQWTRDYGKKQESKPWKQKPNRNPLMTLILAEPVPNLGVRGDVVQVKHGYGRNFLLPKGKAVYAHHLNCKKFGIADIKEKLNEKFEKKQLDDMAVIVRKFMRKKRVVIEQDPLVSDWMIREPHIATALRIQHHLHVPLDYVIIDKPITKFGETKVTIVVSEKEEDVGRGVGNAIEEGGSDKVALAGGNGGEKMVTNGRLCISVPVIVKKKELKTEENDNQHL